MSRHYITFLCSLIFAHFISAMDLTEYLPYIPQDVKEHIVLVQLLDIHNQVNTPTKARDYLISVSLVNKQCNAYANDPFIIRDIIHNLSATLRGEQFYIFFEETIAEQLNTPATQKYKELNNQFFFGNISKEGIELLFQQGADPNYRRLVRRSTNKYSKEHHSYDRSRHKYSSCPLTFYASDSIDNGLKIVEYLLECGANINKQVYDYRPLQVAIECKLPNMVALLLSYKPRFVKMGPIYEEDYPSLAVQSGCQEIIDMFVKHPEANLSCALQEAVKSNNLPLMQDLFDHGATPEMQLERVVKDTVLFPYRLQGVLATTEMLQLFCNNNVSDAHMLDQLISYTKTAKQRAEETLAILEEAQRKLPQ